MKIKQIIINVEKKNSGMSCENMYFKCLFFAIFAIFLVGPITHASISLGSTMSVSEITLSPGQVKNIDVSFFNTGDDDFSIEIEQLTEIESSSSGRDMEIRIGNPRSDGSFDIYSTVELLGGRATKTPVSSFDNSWIALGAEGGFYVPAKKVYFSIEVKDKADYARNVYHLLFRAKTITGEINSSTDTTAIGQVREFPVVVHISDVSPTPEYNKKITDSAGTFGTDLSTDLGNNYVNDNVDDTDNRNYNNPELNIEGLNSIGGDSDSSEKSLRDEAGNLITGLARGNTTSEKGSYNLMTIVIVLLGLFGLYRIWKAR